MGIRQRFQSAAKSFMRFPTRARALGSILLPSTELDYRRLVGDPTGSTIVMACALWMARTFPEAPCRVQVTKDDGATDPIPNHALERLLAKPNPFYSGVVLWMATIVDFIIIGNAYWLKVRNAVGDVIQLWYIPAWMIEPKWDEKNPKIFISHYEYKFDFDKQPIKYLPEDVMHFRYGLDPQNTRKGLSPIANLYRELFTDNEAANFAAVLLKNLGIPGVILSPADEGEEATTDDMEEVKETFMRSFGGDKRGEPLVMRTRTEVKVLSFSPQQLDLKSLRRLPEERATAVLGIPAVVVGFGAGLDRSTFANFAEAREAAFESNLAPLQRLMAAEMTLHLLPDFTEDENEEVYFDLRNVRILQEDQNKRSKRVTEEFEAGVTSRYEARIALGKTATDADKVYRLPKTHIEVSSETGALPLLQQLLETGGGKDEEKKKPNATSN